MLEMKDCEEVPDCNLATKLAASDKKQHQQNNTSLHFTSPEIQIDWFSFFLHEKTSRVQNLEMKTKSITVLVHGARIRISRPLHSSTELRKL